MTKTSASKHTESSTPHWIEWLTGLVSAVLVIGLIAWIGRAALYQNDELPDLSVSVLGSEPRSKGFQIKFEVGNIASVTAADVRVVGELSDGTSVIDTAETTLDYVPAHSKAAGGLIFKTDPAGKTMRLSVKGYRDP